MKDLGEPQVKLSFREIEEILGFPLPPSAHRYSEWWANSISSPQAREGWLAAGYRVGGVNVAAGIVWFVGEEGLLGQVPRST